VNNPSHVQPGNVNERLLTASEVAQRLRVSVATVRRLKQRGELSYVRIGTGSARNVTVRFRKEDVDDFVIRSRFSAAHETDVLSEPVRR
jgi:excisionase family DNA binding protein